MQNTTDVAIIGGGVMGCSIAYYLSLMGVKSTVFEQMRFGWGASSATAGLVAPVRYIPRSSEATFQLGLQSLDMFPTLASELVEEGIDPEFRQSGYLTVAMDERHADIVKEDLAWQGELGLGMRWMEASEIIEREPEIHPDVVGGVYSPKEGQVRGQRLVDALVHASRRRGAAFYEGLDVIALVTDGQRVTGVRTANATVNAGHTVLAAGPWSGIDGRWLRGVKLPIRPVKGQRLLLRKTDFLPRCPVNNLLGTVIPQMDGNVLVGATREEGEFDQEITANAFTHNLANAASIFPCLGNARFVEAHAGVRPGSPDDAPIMGPIPGWDSLSIATGHDWMGIMLSAATGLRMADYITEGDSGPLRPFSISRFDAELT